VAAASLALLFWLLTTATGMIFAQIQWGQAWNWDPKQSAIFILLLIYFAYFALRAAFTQDQKRATAAAAWTVFAALTSPLLTFVLPNAQGVQSLHPQGVVFSVRGMGPEYRLIFWAATAGFLGAAVWLFRINVRIDEMKLKSEIAGLSGGLS
jgi:heme exporter protein C